MRDCFGREIDYLRISVTDRCNLRCRYCMGTADFQFKSHEAILTLEHMAEVAAAAASLGIRKVRITGGEPLVRRGVAELVRMIAAIPGIEDISMTTNGILLPKMAEELRRAGLQRVNISLDTLDPEKFRRISGTGELEDVLRGIRAAGEAGFFPIKLNAVLIGGFNDDEIEALAGLARDHPYEVRFIELMPVGSPVFPESAYIPCSTVAERMPEMEETGADGTARLYRVPGWKGTIGLITPLSRDFCRSCNRIRLTADGKLKTCLHSGEELDISSLHGRALTEALREAILRKPASHGPLGRGHRSGAGRNMNGIGG